MLDQIIFHFREIAAILIGILSLSKIYIFLKYKSKKWKLFNFFYFSAENISLTEDVRRQPIKRLQNRLTIAIVFIAAALLIVQYIILPG